MMRNRGSVPTVPSVGPPRSKHLPPPVVVEVATETEEDVEDREIAREAAVPSPVLEKVASLLSPGRTLRLPVGYLLLAGGVLVLVLTLVYVIGSNRGEAKARAQFEEKFGSQPLVSGVNDPLTLESQGTADGTPGDAPSVKQRESSTPGGDSRRTAADWGPVVPSIEPRQKGWNYFILAEDSLQGAQKLAQFCRDSGLETYVIPGKNDRRRVIAFPGYQGSRLAPEVQALENRIHAIGDKYKSQNKSQTNMRDAYPALYNG